MEYRRAKAIWIDSDSCVTDFGRVFAIGVFIIGTLLQWHAVSWAWSWTAFASQCRVAFLWWFAGGLVLTLSALTPWLIRPLYFAWIFLGQTLGLLVHCLLLAAVFYLVFTPIGLWYRRRCGVITKKGDPKLDTYWEKKTLRGEPDGYYRQF